MGVYWYVKAGEVECDALTLNSLFTACHVAMAWRQALSLYRMGEETYAPWPTRGFWAILAPI